MRFLAAALAALLFVSGCGSDGSSVTPTGLAPLLPLTWTDVPDSLTVGRGETVTFTATLSAAVDASVAITAHDPKVEVSGELIRPGVFRATVTGIGYGDVVVNLVATHPDYDRADAAFDVFADGVFNLQIWRQMVFGEAICPDRECDRRGRSVEERTIRVPLVSPRFHLIDEPSESLAAEGVASFSESETVEVAIRDAMEQLTGKPLAGEITSSRERREQSGWVDVLAVTDAWYERRGRPQSANRRICLSATTGNFIALNVECFRSNRRFTVRQRTMSAMGLALGFYPVSAPGDHMMGRDSPDHVEDFSGEEQFHARLAHKLGHGAAYTDDPLAPAGRSAQSRGPTEPRSEREIFWPAH